MAKHKPIYYYEMCNGDNTTSYYPPSNEEVNFLGPHQRKRIYQNNKKFKRGNNSNYNQGWLQNIGPSNRHQSYYNYNQTPPQQDKNSRLEDTLI